MMVKDESPEPLLYTAERFSLLDDGSHIVDTEELKTRTIISLLRKLLV